MASEYFDDLSDCPVCYEPFSEPKKLSCDHTLCKTCMERMVQDSKIKCPKCNVISNTTNVKTDFRLVQFLEVLAKQAQVLTRSHTGPNPQLHAKNNCGICGKNSARCKCEICMKRLCEDCQRTHLSTTHHDVTPLVEADEETTVRVKQNLVKASRGLDAKVNAFQDAIERVQHAIQHARYVEHTSLVTSKDMRQACVSDVHTFFDAFDSRIVDFTSGYIQTSEQQKRELETKLDRIEQKRTMVDNAVKKENMDLTLEGESLLKQMKLIEESINPPDLHIEIPSIDIARNESWKVGDVVKLELNSGTMQAEEFEKEAATIDVVKRWGKEKVVGLPSDPYSVRHINQQIWVCHKDSITVYDEDLEKQRTISSQGMGAVCDVAILRNGDVVMATECGLYHLDATGNRQLHIIDNTSWFSSVFIEGDTVYAANYDKQSDIRVYNWTDSWYKSTTIPLPCTSDHFITISVRNSQIKACCSNEGRIHVYSRSGKWLQTYGEGGSGAAGKLDYPYICDCDASGAVLVSDRRNHRLQILSGTGQWCILRLGSQVVYPRSAMCINDSLYVVSNEYQMYKIYRFK